MLSISEMKYEERYTGLVKTGNLLAFNLILVMILKHET